MPGRIPASLQMPLAVQLRDEATLENFFVAAEAAPVVHAVQQLLDGREVMLFVHGGKGVGKSHLLQGACHHSQSGAQYLPLGELSDYPPAEVLQRLDQLELVCLDDIQQVLGDDAWEEALFNFYNRAQQRGCRLLLSASAAPRALAVTLPDLRSRLSWPAIYQLPTLNDQDKAAILRFRASRRGLAMSDEVARYIVTRAPRGMDQLLTLLEKLDTASLAQGRRLSVPFVKKVLFPQGISE